MTSTQGPEEGAQAPAGFGPLDPDRAVLRWGVKESLRNYVAGVGGEFAVDAPARVEDGIAIMPLISDSSDGSGRVLRFDGTIRIYAHSGMMNVRWSELQIELADGAARLTSAGRDSADDRVQVAFLVPDPDGNPAFRAGLAEDAAAMFGFTYPVGTELDPIVID